MEAAGLGLSREGDGEEERARGKKDISRLFSSSLAKNEYFIRRGVQEQIDNNVGVHQQMASFCMSASKERSLSVSGGQFCIDSTYMNRILLLSSSITKVK